MASTDYAVLGQVAPTDTNLATLYTVPTGKRLLSSTVSVCNISAAAATYDILVQVAGAAAANKQYLAKNVPLPAGKSDFLTIAVTASPTDVVSVRSSVADALAFNLFGTEITP